jgi:adenosine deaminase
MLNSPDLAGIDLHGVETLPLEPWTHQLWRRAQANGKFTKAHAGEFGPASSVREVVERLGVTRVEHGVRSIEDPAVVDLLKARGVTLDVCPVSNVKLRVAPSLAGHPIARLHRAGVACTVNTDNPFTFGVSLREEYAALVQQAGLSRADLAVLAANGFRAALLPEAIRVQRLAEIDEALRQYG